MREKICERSFDYYQPDAFKALYISWTRGPVDKVHNGLHQLVKV